MQSANLTDEQLWQAIAQNTNAMTALMQELDPAVSLKSFIRQAKLRRSIGKLECDYLECTAELRRRYSLEQIDRRDFHSKATSPRKIIHTHEQLSTAPSYGRCDEIQIVHYNHT